MRSGVLVGTLASLLLASSAALADDPPPSTVVPPTDTGPAKTEGAIHNGTNSVNLSPVGLLYGSISANFEHLFQRTHGLLIEPTVTYRTDGDTKTTGYGGLVGYRWHWSKSQDSGFLGANVGLQFGTGSAKISSTSNGVTEERSFDVNTRVITVTGNVGRRFAWNNGFNITLRIGAGYGNYNVTTDSKDPDAKKVVDLVDDLLTIFPIAFDGEASIGYIF